MAAVHQDELVESPTNAGDVQTQKTNEDRVSMQHLEHDVPTRTPRLTTQSILAVISLCLVYNGYLFTLLMPSVILSVIVSDLDPDPNYPWITITWNLAAAIIVTVGGRLTDIFGRRWFMIIGAALGALGALVGATGQSVSQMIAAGILMGLGGGFQEIVFACVQEIVPNNCRLFILGCLEISNVFAMFSPLIGYAFITYSPISWRACYVWMVSFETAAVVGLYFFYWPPSYETKHKHDGKTKIQLLKELDYVGLFLFTAGCVLLLLGLNWGGRQHPWNSAAVITPIVLSGPLFVALGFYETYRPLRYPILPVKMFKKWRDFTSIIVVTFIGGMLYYSLNVLWPRQSTSLFVPPGDPIIRGVYANMVSFGTICAGILVLTIVPWIGHERWQLVGFLVVQTVMIGSMSTVGVGDRAQAIATVIIIAAVVTPPQFLAFGMVSLGLDDQNDIGVSQGVLGTSRLIGGAIATAIYTAIQANQYNNLIGPKVTEVATASGFSGNLSMLIKAATNGTSAAYEAVGASAAQTTVVRAAALEASAESFQLVYKVAVAFGGLAVLIACTTRSIDVNKKNASRAAILENERKEVEPDEKIAV